MDGCRELRVRQGGFEADFLCFCTGMVSMNGVCDARNFYITIEHRNHSVNFRVRVGTRDLSADLNTEYSLKQDSTHLNMTVPFLAQDVVFEVRHVLTYLRFSYDILCSCLLKM